MDPAPRRQPSFDAESEAYSLFRRGVGLLRERHPAQAAMLLGKALHNDLQPAALSLRPMLRQVLEVGEDFGALGGVVSGSGPTCAFVARDEEHALDIAVALTASGVCRTVRRATGPVVGARVTG